MKQRRRHKGEDAAILALASGASRRKAADAAGVHERTLRGWIKRDPLFQKRVENARDELFQQGFASLVGVCSLAVETLKDLLSSTSDQARLGAARAILENASRSRELNDLAHRIAALEAAQQQGGDDEQKHRPAFGAA